VFEGGGGAGVLVIVGVFVGGTAQLSGSHIKAPPAIPLVSPFQTATSHWTQPQSRSIFILLGPK
jgi:hypothetical protein